MMDRRRFLGAGMAALLLPRQNPSEADRLYDPRAAGRARAPVGDLDNSEMVKGIERQLKCTCPCNLDVFTCRTTDFTCEYSPAMHREVMALVAAGKNSEEVVADFVARYGERVLMAPRPVGFNLAGYLVPGVVMLLGGTVLAVVLLRRHRMAAVQAPTPGAAASSQPSVTDADLERLQRALSEVAD